MLKVAIWIGTAIGLLVVPLASFLFDLVPSTDGPRNVPLVRTVIEVTLAVPAWFLVWLMVQVHVLGWVWI